MPCYTYMFIFIIIFCMQIIFKLMNFIFCSFIINNYIIIADHIKILKIEYYLFFNLFNKVGGIMKKQLL